MKSKPPQLCIIDWNDAHIVFGEPAEARYRQRSVGWKVPAPRGYVRIAMSIADALNEDNAHPEDCLTVPVAMVVQITNVALPEAKKK